jgi:hypothetical protein
MKTNKQIITFILLAVLSTKCVAQSGLRFNDQEIFNVSMSIDPKASFNEKSIDLVAEIEYVGILYVKAGIEYFPGLEPSYFDIHGALGINGIIGRFNPTRLYAGIRLGRIFRENKSRGELFGLESGIDFPITEKLFIGARATYDYRNDGIPLGWSSYWRASGFIRIGIKF